VNTAALRDERGSIMLLAIAFIGITLFAIAIVTDASTLFRQHRALAALADGAALAGAQGIDLDTYYAQGATVRTTLNPDQVRANVHHYLQHTDDDTVRVDALTIDGGLVSVTLTAPMQLTFFPQFIDGPMRASSAASLNYREDLAAP
jgi:uncharacterized membrane protein